MLVKTPAVPMVVGAVVRGSGDVDAGSRGVLISR